MINYVHYQDSHLKLKDLYQDGHWQWDWLATVLPQEVREEFMSLYMCPTVKDTIIWDVSFNGCYTAKTSYQCLTSQAHVSLGGSTSNPWMWSINIPYNIKFFFCLLIVLLRAGCHDQEETNSSRSPRLPKSSTCLASSSSCSTSGFYGARQYNLAPMSWHWPERFIVCHHLLVHLEVSQFLHLQ